MIRIHINKHIPLRDAASPHYGTLDRDIMHATHYQRTHFHTRRWCERTLNTLVFTDDHRRSFIFNTINYFSIITETKCYQWTLLSFIFIIFYIILSNRDISGKYWRSYFLCAVNSLWLIHKCLSITDCSLLCLWFCFQVCVSILFNWFIRDNECLMSRTYHASTIRRKRESVNR